jgi:hypothetical protein
MKKGTLVTLINLLLINFSLCFWDTGHMLVAQIAELTLKNENPSALEFATKLVGNLNSMSHNKISNFVESATWPDDTKKFGFLPFDNFHFLNLPIFTQNFSHPFNYTYFQYDGLGIMVI